MSMFERSSIFGHEQNGQNDVPTNSEPWSFDPIPAEIQGSDSLVDFNFATDFVIGGDHTDDLQAGSILSNDGGNGTIMRQPISAENAPWFPIFRDSEAPSDPVLGSAASEGVSQSHPSKEDAVMTEEEANDFSRYQVVQPSLNAAPPISNCADREHDGMEDEEMEDKENDEDDAEDAFTRDYDLRPGSRDMAVAFSTWIDKDRSGTYDPNFKTPRKFRKGRKVTGKGDDEESAQDRAQIADARRTCDTQRRLENAAARVNGDSWVFTIKLPKEKFMSIAANVTDNWPAEEWNIILAPEDSIDHSTSEEDDIVDQSFQKGYRFRGRPSKPLELKRPDLSGQPAARGCWNCFENGMLDNKVIMDNDDTQACCSLVHDSATWPCQTCVADGLECELITPPKIKSCCERCKVRHVPCSFSTTLNHSGSCLECQNIGHRCVAGPHTASVYRRIPLGNDAPSGTPFIQPVLSCTVCLAAGTRCTLGAEFEESQGRACQECRKNNNRECIIAGSPEVRDWPASKRERRKAKKRKVPVDSTHAEVAESQPSDTQSANSNCPAKTTTEIIPHAVFPPGKYLLTKLCHPILFNHEPHPSQPCHFCSLPKYPILGLGQRLVAIAQDPSGCTTELDPSGSDSTRICAKCTIHFMKMLICSPHGFQKIPSEGNSAHDFYAAFDRLLGGKLLLTDRWCSVCPSPATYQCCRSDNTFGTEKGCGLWLCDMCHTEMTKEHDDSLEDFVDALSGKVDDFESARPFGTRADAELLRGNGELVKVMRGWK